MNRGTLVLVSGIARGMGREAEIEVLARKVEDFTAQGVLPAYTYEDCTVMGGPVDLPAGDYIAYFAAFLIVVARRNGIWLSSGTPVPANGYVNEESSSHAAGVAETAGDAVQSGPRTEEAGQKS